MWKLSKLILCPLMTLLIGFLGGLLPAPPFSPIGANAASGNWSSQYSPVADTLYDIEFVDGRNGWAVGHGGVILHTSDGGTAWTIQYDAGITSLNAVDFVDPRNGWAVGYDAPTNSAVILHTSDGGQTWGRQDVPYPCRDRGLNDVCFADSRNGWIVGTGGLILHTSNGGESWEAQDSGVSTTLEAVFFLDSQHGWAVGGYGTILRTRDGGATWEKTPLENIPAPENFKDVVFVSGLSGWAISGEGSVVHTEDGGESWELQAEASDCLLALDFADRTHGWAVGCSGLVLRTEDGENWEREESGVFNHLYGVCFLDPEHGWAVGTSGVILKYGPPAPTLPVLYFADASEEPGAIYGLEGGIETVLHARTEGRVYNLAFSPDGTLYFSDADDFDLYKVEDGEEILIYHHSTYLRDVAFDTEGNLYFSDAFGAGRDGHIYRLDESGSASPFYTVRLSEIGGFWAGDFAFGPEGDLYLSSGNISGAGIYKVRIENGAPAGVPEEVYAVPEGEPIKGISFDPAGNLYYAGWNENIYRVDLPSGARTLIYSSPERRRISDISFLPPVEAKGIIKGCVLLEDRLRHGGIRICAGEYRTTTGPDGSFSLPVPPGIYDVTAEFPGYGRALAPDVEVEEGRTTSLPGLSLPGGDINGDDTFDAADLDLIARNYGLPGPADLNGDGFVDIYDLVRAAINFGKRGPLSWPVGSQANFPSFISPSIVNRFEALGILDADDLLESADTLPEFKDLAGRSGIPGEELLRTVLRCDLLRAVPDLSESELELLEMAGIRTAGDLAAVRIEDPEALNALYETMREDWISSGMRDQGRPLPSLDEIKQWVTQARALPPLYGTAGEKTFLPDGTALSPEDLPGLGPPCSFVRGRIHNFPYDISTLKIKAERLERRRVNGIYVIIPVEERLVDVMLDFGALLFERRFVGRYDTGCLRPGIWRLTPVFHSEDECPVEWWGSWEPGERTVRVEPGSLIEDVDFDFTPLETVPPEVSISCTPDQQNQQITVSVWAYDPKGLQKVEVWELWGGFAEGGRVERELIAEICSPPQTDLPWVYYRPYPEDAFPVRYEVKAWDINGNKAEDFCEARVPEGPLFKVVFGSSRGQHPGGGDVVPEAVGGLGGFENALVLLKGFDFEYEHGDRHINELGLKVRDVEFHRDEGSLTWNTEVVFGDGGDWPFNDDFSWSYRYAVVAFKRGEKSEEKLSGRKDGEDKDGEDRRIIKVSASSSLPSGARMDNTAVLPSGFRFDFLGLRSDSGGTDDPADHHINEFRLAFKNEHIQGGDLNWDTEITYADANFDDSYFWEADYQVFTSPDILVIRGPDDPEWHSCDGGSQTIQNQAVTIPSGYEFAAVFLRGWEFDFENADHHVRRIAISLENERFDPGTGTLSWDVSVTYRDVNGDDDYRWRYRYTVIAFRSAEVLDRKPEPPVRVRLEGGGDVLASNVSIFGGPDDDGDGLNDRWENEALRLVNPYFELDEEEQWYNHRHEHPAVNFVRVAPYIQNSRRYIIFSYVVTWAKDYGWKELELPEPFPKTGPHNGDTERVVMAWRVENDHRIRLHRVFYSAHERTEFDRSAVKSFQDLALCSGGIIKLYPSENKHAIYNTCGWCPENRCGGGTFRFPAYNIGEPDNPRITDLSPYGEPIGGIQCDSDLKFCGGLGCDGECATPVLRWLHERWIPKKLENEL